MKLFDRTLVFSGALIVSGVVGLIGSEVYAAGNTDPFNSQYFRQSHITKKGTSQSINVDVQLQLGETSYVRDTKNTLKVYTTKKEALKITIHGAHFCPSGGSGDLIQSGDYYANNPGALSDNVTNYFVKGADGYINDKQGVYRPNASHSDCSAGSSGNVVFDIPAGKLQDKFDEIGYYFVRLDIEPIDKRDGAFDGIQNSLRVSASGGGTVKVAHASGGGNQGNDVTLIQQGNKGAYKNVDYNIKFGSDCAVTNSTGPARLTFYDLDNGGGSGAQLNGKVWMTLLENDNSVKFTSHSGGGSQFSDGGKKWTPQDIDNNTQWVEFKPKPGASYNLIMHNVYNNNTIQFSTPYDGIYYEKLCAGWNATPVTDRGGEVSTISPGQTAKWKHRVTKSGTKTTEDIEYTIDWRANKNRNSAKDPYGLPEQPIGTIPDKADKNIILPLDGTGWKETSYPVTDADIGRMLCQNISIKNEKYENNELSVGPERSEPRCFKVKESPGTPYTPFVDVSTDVVEPEGLYDDTGSLTGGNIPSAPSGSSEQVVPYVACKLTYLPGNQGSYPASGNPTSKQSDSYKSQDVDGCGRYGGNPMTNITSGTVDWSSSENKTLFDNKDDIFPSSPYGTLICYLVSVQQPSPVVTDSWKYYYTYDEKVGEDEDGNPIYEERVGEASDSRKRWRHDPVYYPSGQYHDHDADDREDRTWVTQAECVMLGKRVHAQVQGNDLRVRDTVRAKLSRHNGLNWGSWTEYGIFAVNDANGSGNVMSSGAGLRSGSVSNDAGANTWRKLTFANIMKGDPIDTVRYGFFGNLPQAPAIAGHYEGRTLTAPSFGGGSVSGLNGKYRASGNITVSGGSIAAGQSAVIYSTGDVTISGNITYANSNLSDISQIPQLVIVARNIYITGAPTNIDAWLITQSDESGNGGVVNTCIDQPFNVKLTRFDCGSKLEINGPVITDTLYLRRTASNEIDRSQDASEVIRLRPDAYLWALGQQEGSRAAQTVDIVEMPPRF